MPTNRQAPDISYIIPVLNEEENISYTIREIRNAFLSSGLEFMEIIFVDDGSTDKTREIIELHCRESSQVKLICLSRNFGHQAAVTAGLEFAAGKYVAILDGDLQDPPLVVNSFLDKAREGYDVVYGIRQKRKESFGKRFSYFAFYRLLRTLGTSVDIPLDSGDFCLLSRRATKLINQLPEKNRFVRGLRAYIGLRQVGVVYERAARANGDAKYTFRKLFRLASDGIYNFSDRPLKTASLVGFIVSAFSLFAGILLFSQRLTGYEIFGRTPQEVPGFASVIVAIFFLSGVQLFTLGIIGEYLARIFIEAKGRPAYLVSELVNIEKSQV